jgi:CubicO group peptidase (beta-lactamase class C family)
MVCLDLRGLPGGCAMDTKNRVAAGMAVFAAAVIVGLASLLLTGPAGRAFGQSSLPKGAQVDQVFAQWDTSGSPGCAVAVIQGGSIVYERGYGMADLDHKLKITPSTVFHAASLSKQFTAMSVMLLVAQGRLSLDDDVRTYVSDLPDLRTRITIGDMLHHLSGIRDQWIFATMAGWRVSDDVVKLEDIKYFVRRMKALNFKPRDQYLYSNTGYTLASLIVEKVSGQPLADFARDNIFRPLGMADTSFAKTHRVVVQNRAYGYTADRPYQLSMPNYDLTGPTNLLTTVEDLARWDRNFDDNTVGGAAVLSQMQEPAQLSNGDKVPYGLGLILSQYRGLDVVEHDGRDPGYRAHLMRFPDRHFAVACLCNLALPDNTLPGALARKVADIYLFPENQDPAIPVIPAIVLPQGDATPDPYWNSLTGSLALVSTVGGQNFLCFAKDCGVLVPLLANRSQWVLGSQPATVEIVPAHGAVPAQLLFTEGSRTLQFDAMPPAKVTPADLAEYEGRYFSDEIDTVYNIERQGSSIRINRHKYDDIPLTPAFRDGFTMSDLSVVLPSATVRFTRDAEGHVSGFLVDGGNVRNFEFIKQHR